MVLLIFSNGYLIGKAYNLYEPDYPSIKKNYDVAIVLGGFSGLNKRNNEIQFNWASDRLFQTFSLYKKGKVKKILITSGNASLSDNEVKEADLVQKFLKDICIPDSDIIIENQSRNTIENAKFSTQIIEKKYPDASILVVTSAWHVPRARLIFKRFLKTKPDYLPTNYIGKYEYSPEDFIPDPGNLSSWEILFKEWIGYLVDRWRA
ncbi:YdcF family protein [Pedobacter aquatilis]|uniref:YdcF family protein n=1 Tax=Pedobacter aquatilis TaxID=351343 RepID=UPI00292F7835|nr:YdcF family protein [Pedobacter aquatilis]